jgi:hypothetical protein
MACHWTQAAPEHMHMPPLVLATLSEGRNTPFSFMVYVGSAPDAMYSAITVSPLFKQLGARR